MEKPDIILDQVYRDLAYQDGSLFNTNDSMSALSEEDWINKGEWLTLGKKIEVEKIFFVKNNPVIVFSKIDNTQNIRHVYNKIWNMSRPQLLFLAAPGELTVFDLTKPPIKKNENPNEQNRILDKIQSISEVQSKLLKYHKEKIESGAIFDKKEFSASKSRADEALIKDLIFVRNKLTSVQGLSRKYAHSVLARSIFVRYLEDRGILTFDYFNKIAEKNSAWEKILSDDQGIIYANPEMDRILFPKILKNKEFTYQLFSKLAKDFNGDMFPSDDDEKQNVTQEHLDLLQGFLSGSLETDKLFFFAYKFDIIPIDLISRIYEEFYKDEKGEKEGGSHYTTSTLVNFLLDQILTPETLAKSPLVLDPACGSGIFLVETFKRIVRYKQMKNPKEEIKKPELLKILKTQIAGIDINEEAIKIAAFSLYLVFLHFQEPPDIIENKRLPKLIGSSNNDLDNNCKILIAANSFDDNLVLNKKLEPNSVDIVVGNPPWGKPNKATEDVVLNWCVKRNKIISDKELSQAFLHRTLDLLKPNGKAALFVSSGVLFKDDPYSGKSQQFREQWLTSCNISHIYNFVHVRDVFFHDAIAPFIAVIFNKNTLIPNNLIEYWSVKSSNIARNLHSVIFSHNDVNILHQIDFIQNNYLWKTYWWGNHHDAALIRSLKIEKPLERVQINNENPILTSGKGFCEGNKKNKVEYSRKYKELPTKEFKRYSTFNKYTLIKAPEKMESTRADNEDIFNGLRILIKAGPTNVLGKKGIIVSRIVKESFLFRGSIYSIRFDDQYEEHSKIILGILLSSLARYYLFLTSGRWGTWHYEINLYEILNLPIKLPEDQVLKSNIIQVVDKLLSINDSVIFNNNSDIEELEEELDYLIFDLYKLTPAERDLINDRCEYGIDYLYSKEKSKAIQPIVISEKTINRINIKTPNQLSIYGSTFIQYLNKYGTPNEEFNYKYYFSPLNSMIAVRFFFKDNFEENNDSQENWQTLLDKLDKNSIQPFISKNIFLEGMIRLISDKEIVIFKRNQNRYWTKSSAREDFEACMLKITALQNQNKDTKS